MIRKLVLCGALFFCLGNAYAEEVIWSGEVQADGSPTAPIPLVLHQSYQIKAWGTINLGKWVQNGEELADDACYEFGKKTPPAKLKILHNSQNISLDDEVYHPDHIYKSAPFKAAQNRIHFWVSDTDYDDNKGSLHVEIFHL